MNVLLTAFAALMLMAAPAEAGAVAGAIAGISGWFGSLGVLGQSLIRIGLGLALSALSAAKQKTDTAPAANVRSEATLTGGRQSESFVLGRAATSGVFVAPPLTEGERNEWMAYVIDLGPAGQTVETVYVDGLNVDFVNPDGYGMGYSLGFNNDIYFRTYDGSQTVAPSIMTDKYGSHPDYPWLSDMIGTDRLWAVFRFDLNPKNPEFSGLPTCRFDVQGLPLYDPRLDSTQPGGSGAHRWNDPATWEQTENPAVIIYNILRGITLQTGDVWGGGVADEDVPVSVWAAAMNECDVQINLNAGGTESQYKAGIEVRVAEDEPADVIEWMLAACSGEIVEEGGTWYIHIGAPALSSYSFTDDDVLASEPMSYTPFPGLTDVVNGVSIRYPDPEANWEMVEAPRITTPSLEAEDGDRRLMASLDLVACPHPIQAQRIGKAYLEDARRFRSHIITLPPDAAHIRPLETITWTSDENGYSSKLFEVQRKQVDLRTMAATFVIRERDPSDYNWSTSDEVATTIAAPALTAPTDFVLTFTATGVAAPDSGGDDRIPAIEISGLSTGVAAVAYEVRLDGGDVVTKGVAYDHDGDIIITAGLLQNEDYEVRVRSADTGAFAWSAWAAVSTPTAAQIKAADVVVGDASLTDDGSGGLVVQDGSITLLKANTASVTFPVEGDGWSSPPSLLDLQTVAITEVDIPPGFTGDLQIVVSFEHGYFDLAGVNTWGLRVEGGGSAFGGIGLLYQRYATPMTLENDFANVTVVAPNVTNSGSSTETYSVYIQWNASNDTDDANVVLLGCLGSVFARFR